MTTQPQKPSASLIEFTTGDVVLNFSALVKMQPSFKPRGTPQFDAEGRQLNPESGKPLEMSYQATLLIDPKSDLARYKNAMRAATLEKFNGQIPKGMKPMPLRSCDEKDYYADLPGWFFLGTKNTGVQPVLVGPDRLPLAAEKFYDGCVVRARIKAWVYSNAFGKGVSFELLGLQFVRDGQKRAGSRGTTTAEAAFEALELPPELGPSQTNAAAGAEWDPFA